MFSQIYREAKKGKFLHPLIKKIRGFKNSNASVDKLFSYFPNCSSAPDMLRTIFFLTIYIYTYIYITHYNSLHDFEIKGDLLFYVFYVDNFSFNISLESSDHLL